MSDTETLDPDAKPQQTSTTHIQEPQTNGKPAGDVDASAPKKPKFHPATFKQKLYLAAFLLVWVALLLPTIWWMIDRLNASALAEVSVGWEMPPGVTLNPGPAAFRYDATQKKLVHYGVITAERKLELRALFAPAPTQGANAKAPEAAGSPKPEANPASTKSQTSSVSLPGATATTEAGPAAVTQMEVWRRSYSEAIDNLAYLATVRQGNVISLLLLLGGLGGALGAILRSLVDFAGNASYAEQLDLTRWWPLYFTRPLVGAILGFVLVVLLKAQLLTGGNPQSGSDSFWWLGVAVLGGFSTVDVTLRLRMAAKALFGGGEKKNNE